MSKKGGNAGSNDPRFSSMLTAPMFKKSRHDQQKVKLDDRFKSVLSDDRFSSNTAAVDKYGRKQAKGSKKSAAIKELSEFYEVDAPEEEDVETSEKPKEEKKSAESRLDYLQKLSRGEISGDSSSEEESGSEEGSDDSESNSEDESEEDTEVNKGAFCFVLIMFYDVDLNEFCWQCDVVCVMIVERSEMFCLMILMYHVVVYYIRRFSNLFTICYSTLLCLSLFRRSLCAGGRRGGDWRGNPQTGYSELSVGKPELDRSHVCCCR